MSKTIFISFFFLFSFSNFQHTRSLRTHTSFFGFHTQTYWKRQKSVKDKKWVDRREDRRESESESWGSPDYSSEKTRSDGSTGKWRRCFLFLLDSSFSSIPKRINGIVSIHSTNNFIQIQCRLVPFLQFLQCPKSSSSNWKIDVQRGSNNIWLISNISLKIFSIDDDFILNLFYFFL